jgi:spermidine/putrescine transport system substrate-binding protein
MKKLILFTLIFLSVLIMVGCTTKPKLYVLNWGDYIDSDLIDAFETEKNVKVVYRQVGSNEEMATLIQAGSSNYDIAVPSDYMIDKLKTLELIQPIDFELLTHWEELTVIPELSALYEATGIDEYIVPYAWGTIGILYNTDIPDLKSLIEDNGWKALFEYGTTYRVGMYDSPRDAIAAALLYQGYHVNSEVASELEAAEAALSMADFTAWGEDNLKSLVIQGTLDMALVYSGDYFSEYYLAIEDGTDINFDYYVPETTNIWVDAMVIPNQSQNVSLAHEFIDFFLEYEHALQNSDYIGYAPAFEEIYDTMVHDSDYGYDFEAFDPFPEGTFRQMYQYGTDARSEALVGILARAKTA